MRREAAGRDIIFDFDFIEGEGAEDEAEWFKRTFPKTFDQLRIGERMEAHRAGEG